VTARPPSSESADTNPDSTQDSGAAVTPPEHPPASVTVVRGVDPANPVAGLNAYEIRYLGAHLEASGNGEALERLLALESEVETPAPPSRAAPHRPGWRHLTSRAEKVPATVVRYINAWQTAKEAIGDTAGYRDDVERARRMAVAVCRSAAAAQTRVPIERELRCALLAASLTSLGSMLPGELLVALVRHGVWDESQALAYAEPEGDVRYLLPVMSPETRKEAVRRILAAASEGDSAVVYDLAPFLSEAQVLEALRKGAGHADLPIKPGMFARLAVRLIDFDRVELALKVVEDDVTDRLEAARVLAVLAPHLSERQAREAIRAARSWPKAWGQEPAFAAIYPRLADLGHVAEALDAAAATEDVYSRAEMLRRIAPSLNREQCGRAFSMVPTSESFRGFRTFALLSLGSRAASLEDDELATKIVDDAFATIAAGNIFDFERCAAELAKARPQQAVVVANGYQSDSERLVALAAVAPHLPPDLTAAVREAAERIPSDWRISDTSELVALSHFDPDRVIQLVQAGWTGEGGDSATVGKLAAHLPPQHLLQLRQIAAQLGDVAPRNAASIALDAQLAALGNRDALGRLAEDDPQDVVSAELAAIAPDLPQVLVAAAVETVAGLPAFWQNAPARALAPRMSPEQMAWLIHSAANRGTDESFAGIVSASAAHIPETMVASTIRLALSRRDRSWRQDAAIALVPRGDVGQLAQIREKNRPRRGWYNSYNLEAAVAIRLAQLGHTAEALAVVTEIPSGAALSDALRGVAPHLHRNGEIHRAESLALPIQVPEWRARALSALSVRSTEPDKTRLRELAIAAAEQAAENDMSGEPSEGRQRNPNPVVMAELASELGGDVYERALALALAASQDQERVVKILAELGEFEGEALRQAINLARKLEPHFRPDAFVAILTASSHPPAELLTEAVRACLGPANYILSPRSERLRPLYTQMQHHGTEVAHADVSDVLSLLARRGRHQVADYIRAIAPLTSWLGGQEALRSTKTAIEDAARWWA
jgi:hypothetical protein